jgi:O-antigen/teichoic acid export membrane protein
MVLSHLILPGVSNRWQWDHGVVREITRFGKWILLSSVLGFFVNSGDRLLLGGLVDAKELGYYSIASLFVGSIEAVLSKIMGDVSFPAFSEIVRTRPEDLRRHYYKFFAVVASVAYFVSGGLMAAGGTLVSLLYDSRYQAAGWILQLLAAMLIAIPFRLATQSLLALGIAKMQSNMILIRLLSLISVMPLGFFLAGYRGAILAVVFSQFTTIPVAVLYSIRYRLFDLWKEMSLLALVPGGFLLGEIASSILLR